MVILNSEPSKDKLMKDFYLTENAIHVSPHSLRGKMTKGVNDYILVDLRSQEEYETEHIINPKVKVGDKVVAGQVIAEVSNYNKNLPGFGIVEIGILKGGNPPQHICPFSYLDPSIKEETFKKNG